MKYTTFTILLLMQCLFSIAQEKKVLFIGNSLTYYNDMPQTLQKMIDEQNLSIKIDQITPPGCSLVLHAKFKDRGNNTASRVRNGEISATVEKILSENWDIVILQEGPTSVLIPERLKYCTLPAVLFLDSVIKVKHSKTILYQNFTQQAFPATYSFPIKYGLFNLFAFDSTLKKDIPAADSIYSPHFQNSTQEFEVLEKEYNSMAKLIHADIAEVGYYFERCKKEYPTIPLYFDVDDSHPSKEGSYLMACVFFRSITKQKLSAVKFCGDVDEKTAKILRNLADEDRD